MQDPSVYVRFRTVEDPRVSYLAWTTTPWTLISNVALAVGPDIDYVQVRLMQEDGAAESLVLAKDRLIVLGDSYEIEREFKGADLVGREYTPLFDYFVEDDKDLPVAEASEADLVLREGVRAPELKAKIRELVGSLADKDILD